jgi:PEP-CTERM motif
MTNGYWTFTDPSLDIKGITISEGSDIMSNSLEVAQTTTSVPEPSTWAMMLAGFASLGWVGYSGRRAIRSAAA